MLSASLCVDISYGKSTFLSPFCTVNYSPRICESLECASDDNYPQHKVDGDSMTEETKAERQQDVQHYVSQELTESSRDVLVSYHLTSIYDHSALEAFSKVSLEGFRA